MAVDERYAPLLLPMAILACAEPAPTSFARGADIPIAAWVLEVQRVEVLSAQTMPAAAVQLLQTGEKLVAVHIGLEYTEPSDDILPDFRDLLRGVHLANEAGDTWNLRSLPLTDMHWRSLKSGAAPYSLHDLDSWSVEMRTRRFLKSWVLPFFVPGESRGFSLFVENYAPSEGQPRLAVVPLGR